MFKLLILTTEKKTLTWRSLPTKLKAIKSTLNSGKNADFDIEIKYIDTKPLVLKERIDQSWLYNLHKPYFSQGYDIIALHMSIKQWNDLKLPSNYNGFNPNRTTELGDLYFKADENTKHFRGGNQFIQTLLHELSHEYFDGSKLTDTTHLYHSAVKDISGIFKSFDWAKYQPERIALRNKYQTLKTLVNSIQSLFALLRANSAKNEPKRLQHPVEAYKNLISQDYGVVNKQFYPVTEHHIGIDYACPKGTPVLAPFNGEVIISGNSPALGNFCHYRYEYEGVTYVHRFMHLQAIPAIAKYKRSEVIEYTGDSGKVTGAHLHEDIWFKDVRLDIITKTNWMNLTIDPKKHYAIT